MKKQMLDLRVVSNQSFAGDYTRLRLTAAEPLPEMLPGQFVEVRVDGSPTTYLRRPLSVHFVDKVANELWLLIQQVGDGTRAIAQAREGDRLNLLLPLGNSFSLPASKDEKLLLLGGGVGVAPLLFLGAHLKAQGFTPQFLLGGRSEQNLLLLDEYVGYGTVHTTTEDGSYGEQGYVTDHSILKTEHFDRFYVCGPTPMMKAVARLAAERNIACEVSLENTMACGIGACLCCVTPTKEGHKCVCTDGPVFNSLDLENFGS